MAATPVLVLHVWNSINQRNDLRASTEDQLVRDARLLAAQQALFFVGGRDVLNTVLAITAINGPLNQECGSLLTSIVADSNTFASLSVADAGGVIMCSSSAEKVGTGISPQLLANAAAFGFAIGDPGGGEVPVALQGSGDSEGLIAVGSLSLETLTSTMAMSRLPPDAIGVVFNIGRTILAIAPSDAIIDDALFAPVSPQVAPSGGGVGLVDGGTGGERSVWAVADLLPNQGLYVALGVPLSAVLADANANLWRGMAILLVVFLSASFIAWRYGQVAIGRPLARLRESAASMRGGNYAARPEPASTARELRDLETSFSDMAHALEARETELNESNVSLQSAVDEREMLVREMNHRIKNSLQLVSSIVGLQLQKLAGSPGETALRDAQARISAIAKVHERLYAGARLDRVDAAPYLNDLSRDLVRTLAVDDGLKLTVRAAGLSLPPDEIIPVGMIVCELVTNAIKHGGHRGTVHVILKPRGNDALMLCVTDKGSGFPAGIPSTGGKGLGLRVAEALAQQLGSELEIKRTRTSTRIGFTFASSWNEPDCDVGDAPAAQR